MKKSTLINSLSIGFLATCLYLFSIGSEDVKHSIEHLQTSQTCISNQQFSISSEGMDKIHPSQILASTHSDYSNFVVEIINPALGNDTVTCDMVGSVISVEVVDTMTNARCVGTFIVEDKLPPIIPCDTIDLACTIDPFADNIDLLIPDVSDNCTDSADLDITWTQTMENYNCGSPYIRIAHRTWSVSDASNRTTTCTQVIRYLRPELDSIKFPSNDTLYCPATNTAPEYTGFPTLDSFEVGVQCGLMATKSDSRGRKCGNSYKLIRRWTVMDWCSSDQAEGVQIIMVIDTTPPIIECPEDFVIGTSPGLCYAIYDIPPVSVIDSCSDQEDIRVNYYVNGALVSNLNQVELRGDTNQIRVQAWDGCLNYNECTYNIIVEDREDPQAACSETNVSLAGNGMAIIQPHNLENLFFTDNCGLSDTLLRRVNSTCNVASDLNFGDSVKFCCEDIGEQVMVEVMIIDQAGRSNRCMFIVNVLDKLPPRLNCPADMTLSCDQIPDDLNSLGSPTITDGCNFMVDSSVVFDLDVCQTGEIRRTWTAEDSSGNIGSCTQTITVFNNFDFDTNSIVWPPDTFVSACNGQTSPEDLNSFPRFTNTPCGGIGFESWDMIENEDSACSQIRRWWRIIDSCENETYERYQIIDIENNAAPPLFVPQDITLFASTNCEAPHTLVATTDSVCNSGVSITNDRDPQQGGSLTDDFPVGETIVEFTVRDGCGNERSEVTRITVVDTVPPRITCPDDLTVNTDGDSCRVFVNIPPPVATDNCMIRFIENNITGRTNNSSAVYNVGTTTVQFIVEDVSGNRDTCEFTVTVEDETPPALTCPSGPIDVVLDANCEAVVPNLIPEINYSDNCTPRPNITVNQNPAAGTPISVGTTNVTITVTDGSSNSSNCVIPVRVRDTSQIRLTCPDGFSVELDNNCSYTVPDLRGDAMVMEDCSTPMNLPVSQSPAPGTVMQGDGDGTIFIILSVNTGSQMLQCSVRVILQDTEAPRLTCPQDMTINCNDDVSDLSDYGSADATDNCDNDVSIREAERFVFGDCGLDTIYRTFFASDNSGNTASCVQVIIVEGNSTVLTEDDFIFEDTIMAADCNFTRPEDLPGSIPRLDPARNLCNIISVNFRDSAVPNPVVGCADFYRIYTVTDSCNDMELILRQLVAVQDTGRPQLILPFRDTTIFTSDCDSGFASLPPVGASDCAGISSITNNSPFNNGGGDLSGTYPYGDNVMLITATDNCGNQVQDSVIIRVSDTLPDLLSCRMKIIKELDSITEVITFRASEFLIRYEDECGRTPEGGVDVSYDNRIIGDSIRVINCDSVIRDTDNAGYIDTTFMYVYVGGQLRDSCLIELAARDNFVDCSSSTLAGMVTSPEGQRFDNAIISIRGNDMSMALNTNEDGVYNSQELSRGESYKVEPTYNQHILAGLSSYDLLLMTRHILGLDNIESPYYQIAADVNSDNKITVSDVNEIRSILLRKVDSFPAGAWRFIDANFAFPDPSNAINTPYPTSKTISWLGREQYVDFIGFKVGDVDGSIDMVEGRSEAVDILVDVNDDGEIEFIAGENNSLFAMQIELNLPTNSADFINSKLIDVSNADYNIINNKLLLTWFKIEGLEVNKGDVLFTLPLIAENEDMDGLSVDDQMLKAQWVTDAKGTALNIDIRDKDKDFDSSAVYDLYQNSPNPWKNSTVISFNVPSTQEVTLEVYDQTGRIVFVENIEAENGYNEFVLGQNDIPRAGVYFYKVKSKNFSALKSMIIAE